MSPVSKENLPTKPVAAGNAVAAKKDTPKGKVKRATNKPPITDQFHSILAGRGRLDAATVLKSAEKAMAAAKAAPAAATGPTDPSEYNPDLLGLMKRIDNALA